MTLALVLLGSLALSPGVPLSAAEPTSEPTPAWVDAGRALPVLAEGRLMPLDTWARTVWFRLTGMDQAPEAAGWLLQRLAGFEQPANEPLFLVNDPAVLAAEGVVGTDAKAFTERRRYSLAELGPLTESSRAAALRQRYTSDNTALGREGLRLAMALETWNSLAEAPTLLARVLPLSDDPTTRQDDLGLLLYWQAESHAGRWYEAAPALALLASRSSDTLGFANPVALEGLHDLVPWTWLLGVLVALAWAIRMFPAARRTGALAFLVTAALLVVTAWLVLRMLITGRPPVTNLASTFLFTGWLCLAVAFVLVWRPNRQNLARIALTAGGLVPLFSGLFVGAGDPFAPLQAVLNTNFWLSIHVTMISAGYSAVLLAAVLGHAYLWRSTAKRPSDLEPLWKALSAALVWGLALTIGGTLLGGFWADQSWGRFWGWDPKENGALLILLWTALTLHLRPARLTQEWGTALAAALAFPVLLFSWLGVNLLGAGFHSYGATTGRATLFVGLLAAEALTLALLILRRVLR